MSAFETKWAPSAMNRFFTSWAWQWRFSTEVVGEWLRECGEVQTPITEATRDDLVRAGAEMIVAGTSVFGTPDPAAAVRKLHQMATEALATRV